MLKMIAFLSMFIDHIGFFWDIDFLRIIGRVSFPIYCFLVVIGSNRTKNIKKYLVKLLSLAIISQFVCIYIGIYTLNVVFDYFLFVVYKFFVKNKHYPLAFVSVIIMIMISPYVDYGLYGFLILFIFDLIKDDLYRIILIFISTIYFINLGVVMPVQIFAVLSVFVISKYNKAKYNNKFRRFNNLFYVMYPLHLLILFFVYRIIN